MFKLNLDDDLQKLAQVKLDTDSEWFKNLPVAVQIEKLRPFLQLQTERDRIRFNLDLDLEAA